MDLQKFTYPACPLPSHSEEPLARICLDQKCKAHTPVCCICQFQSHKGHHTVPIKQIVKQINESNFAIEALDLETKLSALKTQYFQSINRCKKGVLEQLYKLQVKGEIYFNRCQEAMLGFYSLKQPLSPQILSDAKLYKRYFFPSQSKKNFSLGERFNNLMQSHQGKHKKMCEQIGKIEIQIKKFTQLLDQNFGDPLNLPSQLISIKWSQTLKGTKIKIAQMLAEQTGMESSGQRFALIEESLPLNAASQWAIKVKKFVGWIGVGICLKNCIKSANYHFNYTNLGHGSYLISTNGYSWSHSVKEYNSAFKTFQFTTNDTVYIQYDPIAQKLRFKKNNGPEKFELDVASPPAGDYYHPCVNLCSTGDSVQLIHPGVSLS